MQQPFFIACWQIPCRKNSLSSHAGIRPAVPRTVSQQAAPPHLPQAVLPARETRLLPLLLYAVLLGVGMFVPAQGNGGETARSLCVYKLCPIPQIAALAVDGDAAQGVLQLLELPVG